MRFLASLITLLFLGMCGGIVSHTTEPFMSSYQVSFNKNSFFEQDTSMIPQIFKIVGFEYSGQGSVSSQEVQRLLGLTFGAFVTREQFLQGVERLVQKSCFEKGTFYFVHEDQGTRVKFQVNALWILRSVKIKGIPSGKEEYLRLYDQTVGNSFSLERHEESLKNIKEFLEASGYKEARVQGSLAYDEATKTVVVSITIKKGKIATISKVAYQVKDTKKLLSDAERKMVEDKITKLLLKRSATKKLFDKAVVALKKWLTNKGFLDSIVTITESKNEKRKTEILVTVVLEKRRKTIFFGNHYFSDHDLQKKLTDLVETEVFLPSSIAAQELQTDYEKKGYFSALVENADDGVDCDYFIIKEGKRCSIKKIVLKGVESFDKKWMEKHFFKTLQRARFFDDDRFQQALHECVTWYKKQGFWDVTVTKQDCIPFEADETKQTVIIVVDEGKQRFLHTVEVHHFPGPYDDLPFLNELNKAQGPLPFSADILSLQRTFLSKRLRDQGYLHARLVQRLKEEKNGYRVVWSCDKGPRVLFGKTITRGYTKVSYDRVMKLLSYEEGQLWSKEKVQQSLTALRSLDIFERVSLYPSFKDEASDSRDMILMLKEDDPFEVKVRLGFAQVSKNFAFKKGSTYKAGGSFIWKNPLACADRFAVDVDYNRYEKKINASYKVPFLFDFPINTVFKAYANKYIQPVYIGSNKPLYQVLQQGFLMGVSKKNEHCDLGLTAGFEWMETNDISLELAQAINFKTDLVDKKIPYFFIEPMVYADFLNETLNPTQGFFGLATIKGMFPFKESSFLIKFLAEQGTFIPFDPAVVAIRFRAGHIFRREFNAVMPPERFYLGGPNSLRGYVQDYCPPLGKYIDDLGNVQYVPQGGKTMLNANFELRFPFKQQAVWGAAFQDFGILIEDVVAEGIGASRPLAATGFGIRYMTPVGPLRFDIGWKWHKDRPEDSSYAWFLIFGNAF